KNRQQSEEEQPTPINGSSEMSLVREDIEILSQVSLGGYKSSRGKNTAQQDICRNVANRTAAPNDGSFSINRVMTFSEQFAICGIGGLLVKHHNRRAGLNQKNQICLL